MEPRPGGTPEGSYTDFSAPEETQGLCPFIMRSLLIAVSLCLIATGLRIPAFAQEASQPVSAPSAPLPDQPPPPLRTTRDRWNLFVHETVSPLSFGGAAFNAVFSQATDTDPRYGADAGAFAERFGASLADIASENFFGDFLVASAFREDPRYVRKGEGHSFLYRTGYAISRAVVIRKDSGGNQFNFDNVLGSAMSAGFSNLYYPAPSRTRGAILMHFWIDVADNGFVNLAPEFWPDFRRKVLRLHRR